MLVLDFNHVSKREPCPQMIRINIGDLGLDNREIVLSFK